MTAFGPMNYIDYKKKIEFSKEEYDEIDKYCNMHKIQWFASAWDVESVNFLSQYKLPFIKIASPSVTDIELINKIKSTSKSVIMSTGMSTKEEIDKSIGILDGNLKYILHTTSSYPTPNNEMNMRAIKTLQTLYGNKYKIGFSNHCIDLIYIVQSYIMGAEMIEFHITLDRNLPGTDQFASIGPIGFDKIMKHINNIYVGWGDGTLKVQDSEIPIKKKLRRST